MSWEKLKLYLCYTRSQESLASSINDFFVNSGSVQTFFDKHDIPPGTALDNRMKRNINQQIIDSDYFIVLYSEDMFESEWVEYEITCSESNQKGKDREFIVLTIPRAVSIRTIHVRFKKIIPVTGLDDSEEFKRKLFINLFKLTGMHLRGKFKYHSKNNKRNIGWESATRKLADLDFPTLTPFFESCKKAEFGTFYNVQVTSDEWFAPNMQIHLAVQEGIAQCIRWDLDSPKKNGISQKHMPFRRVSFIASTRHQLESEFENARISAKHLCALMHIHNLMSCPFAIITVDELAKIIAENYVFFSNEKTARVLGIKTSIVKDEESLKTEKSFMSFTKKLLKVIEIQANDVCGRVDPSMDFAIFHHRGIDDIAKYIWFGKVASDGALAYFQLPFKHGSGVDYDSHPEIEGIKFNTEATNKEIYECLTQFSEIVEKYVFNDDVPVLDLKQEEFINKFFAINPLANALGLNDGPNITQLIKVREKYCPWMLLYKHLDSPAGQLNNMKISKANI